MSDTSPAPGSGSVSKPVTESGLAFFGAITAGVSHELNNVISVIDQVTGLLEDQLAAVQVGQPMSPDRLRDIHGRIQKQVQRGVATINHLNRFAHTVDEPYCEFELGAGIRNLLALAERFARLRQSQIQAHYPAEEIRMTGNPFRVQQAVFLELRSVLASAEPSSVIEISLHRADANARIEISGPAMGFPEGSETGVRETDGTAAKEQVRRQAELDEVLTLLSGRSEVRNVEGRRIITLTVPIVV